LKKHRLGKREGIYNSKLNSGQEVKIKNSHRIDRTERVLRSPHKKMRLKESAVREMKALDK